MLNKIAEEIRNCTKCHLAKTRTNAVPGEGNPNARIVFIGEAPGREEDLQGRPFVGAAGKFLTQLIEGILGIPRSEVFITNVVKCRPVPNPNVPARLQRGNREPTEEEIRICSPYLDRQLEIIQPDIIVCLGRHSAKYILSKIGFHFSSLSKIRGNVFEGVIGKKKVKVFVTFHPAAALYKPPWRKIIEDDFRYLKSLMEGKRTKITLEDFF